MRSLWTPVPIVLLFLGALLVLSTISETHNQALRSPGISVRSKQCFARTRQNKFRQSSLSFNPLTTLCHKKPSFRSIWQTKASKSGANKDVRINIEGLVLPPESLEESLTQASNAVVAYLKTGKFKTKVPKTKGRAGRKAAGAMKELMELSGKTSGGARMALEMSIGAEDPHKVARMAITLSKSLPRPISIRFADPKIQKAAESLLDSASASSTRLSSIENGNNEGSEEATLMLVGAEGKRLGPVVSLVDSQAKKTNIVLLNADFTPQPPNAARGFVDTFEVIYSVLPLQIQGFMSSKQGSLFRAYQDKERFFWRAFMAEGKDNKDKWKAVGSWKVRPNAKQLEDAMYGNGAAENPVNKGIEGFKSMFG
ncbi:hypothetical protein AAMO2058_000981800 [Amorphochlora amoebiformis]